MGFGCGIEYRVFSVLDFVSNSFLQNGCGKVATERRNKISTVYASVYEGGGTMVTGTVNTSIVTALTSIAADLTATLGAVAPLAIGIMGIFLAWRYGKRLFKTVAR